MNETQKSKVKFIVLDDGNVEYLLDTTLGGGESKEKEGESMRRRLVLFAAVLAVAVFVGVLNVGCTDGLLPQANVVRLKTLRGLVQQNVDLVFFRDGEGTWTKLTGTKGEYTFEVKDPQGRYSVAAVAKTSYATEVAFLHATVGEAKSVALKFYGTGDEDSWADLTIVVPNAYNGKHTSVFFLWNHGFPTVENGKVTVGVPKGKADLVFFIGSIWNETFIEKVAIRRGLEVTGDMTVTLTESDFHTPEVANGFERVHVDWLVGGTTWAWVETNVVGGTIKFVKYPATLKTDKDLYMLTSSVYPEGVDKTYRYQEYRSAVPVTRPYNPDTIKPAVLPQNFAEATVTSDGRMRLTITPQNANVTGLTTKFYYFEANGKNGSVEDPVPGSVIRYKVLISTDYLQKISNQYEVPLVNIPEFRPYNTRDFWYLNVKRVISMNDKFEKYFAPVDGLKVLEQE